VVAENVGEVERMVCRRHGQARSHPKSMAGSVESRRSLLGGEFFEAGPQDG